MGQSGWVQTFRTSPLSRPSATMASVVYLHVLNSGHFAFSGVSGFSGLISTYLLRVTILLPSCCWPYVKSLTKRSAEALVAAREADGPFRSAEDLAQRVPSLLRQHTATL